MIFIVCVWLIGLVSSQNTIELKRVIVAQTSMYRFREFTEEIFTKEYDIGRDNVFRHVYYGEIQIGTGTKEDSQKKQKFKVIFDTASAEFWIMSDKCSSEQCLANKRYTNTLSMREHEKGVLDVRYEDGIIEGKFIKDDVYFGKLKVKNQAIGLAEEVNVEFMKDIQFDGLVGLAKPYDQQDQEQVSPLMTTVKEQEGKAHVCLYLGKKGGAITLNGVDERYMNDPKAEWKWVPMADKDYWVIEVVGFHKILKADEEKGIPEKHIRMKQVCDIGCKAIFDTARFFLYGPTDFVKRVTKEIVIEDCNDLSELPDIIIDIVAFNVGGREHIIKLRFGPKDYIVTFGDSCMAAFVEDEYNHGWVFGSVFFRSYYTQLDYDNNKIGFVRAKVDPDD